MPARKVFAGALPAFDHLVALDFIDLRKGHQPVAHGADFKGIFSDKRAFRMIKEAAGGVQNPGIAALPRTDQGHNLGKKAAYIDGGSQVPGKTVRGLRVQAAARFLIGRNDEIHDEMFAVDSGVFRANAGSHGLSSITEIRRPGKVHAGLALDQIQMFQRDALFVGNEKRVAIAVDSPDFNDAVSIEQREGGKQEHLIGTGITILDRRQGVEQDQIGNRRLEVGLDALRCCSRQDQLFGIELVLDNFPHLPDGRKPQIPGSDKQQER